MQEKTPLSGRVIWFFHERYIRNRKLSDTDTEVSISMSILKHVENNGIVGGFPAAWRELYRTCENSTDYEGEESWREATENERKLIMLLIATYGAYEFFLISMGFGLKIIDEEGDWKFLYNPSNKIGGKRG